MSTISSYRQLRAVTNLPQRQRKPLAIGRGGEKVVPRRFHLTSDEITDLKAEFEKTGVFPNPHNSGFYNALVAALVDAGLNEKHSQAKIFAKVQEIMSNPETKDDDGNTAWNRFHDRKPRNKKTALDVEGRFNQNIAVLQRLTGLTPYGLKLQEVGQRVLGKIGAVIDVLVGERGARYLRLNTNSARPINESKVRGAGSPAELKAERAKKAKKAARAKAAETPAAETVAAA